MSKPTDKGRAFVARLETLVEREDRGALAALRRGLGKPPGTVPEMCPLVEPWLSGDPDPWRDDPYYIVAALFAFWHQGARAAAAEAGPPRSLGASERRLGFDEDGKWSEDRFKGVERRFVALLNCHRDDLHVHLRHCVGLLRSKAIPVDWAQLLADIRGWDSPRRAVQRDWAKAFWRRPEVPAVADQPEAPAAVDAE
jgi:CRISPR system Cascade subunit CasB